MKYCEKCNLYYNDSSSFCRECGSTLITKEEPKIEQVKEVATYETVKLEEKKPNLLWLYILIGVLGFIFIVLFMFNFIFDVTKSVIDNKEETNETSTSYRKQYDLADIEILDVGDNLLFQVKENNLKSDIYNHDIDRYLSMSVYLGLYTKDKNYKKDKAVLEENIDEIKQIIADVIKDCDLSQFDGGTMEYHVKDLVIDKINKKYKTNVVCDCYFSDKVKV